MKNSGNNNGKIGKRAQQRAVKIMNIILVAVPFLFCWMRFYSYGMLMPFHGIGKWIVVFLFMLLYYCLAHLYSGFLINLSKISELIYAQILAVLLSNFFIFIVIILLVQRIPNVLPILSSIIFEICIIVLWCVSAHKWYFKKFRAKRTVVVWDEREGLEDLIKAYGMSKHFSIVDTPNAKVCLEHQFKEINNAEVVFLYGVASHDRNKFLKHCVDNGIVIYVIPRIGDVIMSGAQRMHMFHLPMLMVERFNPTPEYLVIKRVADIVFSTLTIILLFPLFVVVSIGIKATDGGSVFYNQKRLTKDGKEFYVHKFRSMRVDAEKDGVARLSTGENDSRITPVGRIIRKYRIDEFPQLLNIIKGEMSIVGPRPERPEISEQYEKSIPEFKLRLQVKAGLTGYAQVYGKYNTTPYDKLLMDLMYIAKPSLAEDCKIIFATIKILFMPESTEGFEPSSMTPDL